MNDLPPAKQSAHERNSCHHTKGVAGMSWAATSEGATKQRIAAKDAEQNALVRWAVGADLGENRRVLFD